MPTLSFNTVVAAAITVGVIAALIFGPKMMYASSEKATNFLEKYIPIPFVKPHFNEFTATPELVEGKIAMDFKLALGGIPKDSVLEIYMSKASDDTSATELKAPDPVYDETHIIYSSKKLSEVKDHIGKGAVKITCPPGSRGCHSAYIDDKNWVDNFEPDWYTFTAVIKGEKSVEKSATVGIYDDNYVERLNKPVANCPAKIIGIPGIVGVDQRIDTQNCNVVECKKGWMNYRVMTDIFMSYQGGNPEDQIRVIQNTINSLNNELEENKNKFEGSNDDNEKKALKEKMEDLTKRIATFTNQIIALKKAAVTPTPIKLDYAAEALNKILTEIKAGSSCVESDKKTGGLNFDKCGASDVDAFSKKFARYEMFVNNLVELRNSAQDKNKVSEADYSRLSRDKLQKFFDNAVQKAMYCSRGSMNDRGTSEYASYSPYSVLIAQRWQRRPGTSSTTVADVEQELSKILADVSPAVINLKTVANPDKSFTLSWEVPLGLNNVKAGSYRLTHYYRRWAANAYDWFPVETIPIGGSSLGGLPKTISVPGSQNGQVTTSYTISASSYPTGKVMGEHKFSIEILDKAGQAVFQIWSPPTGFFDDTYLDLYLGGNIEGKCLSTGKENNMGYPCNVILYKKETLRKAASFPVSFPTAEGRAARTAFEQTKAGSDCKLADANGYVARDALDGCTVEEIDQIWVNYARLMGFSSGHNCNVQFAGVVCAIKNEVATTAISLGWKDLRTK